MHFELIDQTAADAVVSSRTCGILAGTGIYTADGVIPVEHLSPGDRIITRNNGISRLKQVRSGAVKLKPVVVKAGSLGFEHGSNDIAVPPHARLHIRDWRAMAVMQTASADIDAAVLLDGEFVTQAPEQTVQVCELVFDGPETVYADGLEISC